MSHSSSSPTNTTSTDTSLTTKNDNVSGNSGLTVVGSDGSKQSLVVNQSTTDLGAIGDATGLSMHALDVVTAANRDSISAVRSLASESLTSTDHAYGQALTAVQDDASNTVSVISKLATTFGTALEQNFNDSQTQLGNVVSALGSTFASNNTSANQQVINATTEAGDKLVEVVKYIVLSAAIGVAVYYLTKK